MLVDIICGFLGAGKTTLINKLIATCQQRGEKLVIIENEYGKVNIDKYLFESTNIAVYEMTSGCLCCSLKGNLELSLQEIRDHIQPDRIIIEPSGIFVIDEILHVFNTLDFQIFKMNQIITVVDGVHFMRYRHKYNAILGAQMREANVIVISKWDKETDEELLLYNIRVFNAKAPIINKPWETLTAEDLNDLIDKKETVIKKIRRKIKSSSCIIYKKNEVIAHQFKTELVGTKAHYTEEEFQELLKQFKAKNILRCKGFLSIKQTSYLFQYVDGEYSLEKTFMPIQEFKLVMIANM